MGFYRNGSFRNNNGIDRVVAYNNAKARALRALEVPKQATPPAPAPAPVSDSHSEEANLHDLLHNSLPCYLDLSRVWAGTPLVVFATAWYEASYDHLPIYLLVIRKDDEGIFHAEVLGKEDMAGACRVAEVKAKECGQDLKPHRNLGLSYLHMLGATGHPRAKFENLKHPKPWGVVVGNWPE